MADDHGAPIAYMVLAEGTPVLSSDGERLGTVKRVLADDGADLFDGIVVKTDDGDRFVDAPEVGDLYERAAYLTLTAAQVRELAEPSAAPAVVDVSGDDLGGGDGAGDKVRDVARRTWDRITGNY